jgi:hypothetical protein
MSHQSADKEIGEPENLAVPSAPVPLPTSTSAHRITLDDMPEDIIHIIASELLGVASSTNRYLRYLTRGKGSNDDASFERHRCLADLLALSSTCKWVRQIVFPEWILRDLVVRFTKGELEDLRSLSEEIRREVRYDVPAIYLVYAVTDTRPEQVPFYHTMRPRSEQMPGSLQL